MCFQGQFASPTIDDSPLVKQGSDEWKHPQSLVRVTGSTTKTALGLDSLKKQQEHFAHTVPGKIAQSPSSKHF